MDDHFFRTSEELGINDGDGAFISRFERNLSLEKRRPRPAASARAIFFSSLGLAVAGTVALVWAMPWIREVGMMTVVLGTAVLASAVLGLPAQLLNEL